MSKVQLRQEATRSALAVVAGAPERVTVASVREWFGNCGPGGFDALDALSRACSQTSYWHLARHATYRAARKAIEDKLAAFAAEGALVPDRRGGFLVVPWAAA
jgi:hypothetical protein